VGVLGRVAWSPKVRVTPFMRWVESGFQFNYRGLGETDVGWGGFVTANVSVKRAFMDRVGGFDEEHFPYGYEDTEWSYRASKLGFRLHYNQAALAHHLRTMTLEFWQQRARRIATAEYTFASRYPEVEPHFFRLFSNASRQPPAHGRGIPLARFVSPRVPWLGRRVWASVDRAYRQAIAPYFLEAWEATAQGHRDSAQVDLSEFGTR
jgi:GT2 family glycosyltransferase